MVATVNLPPIPAGLRVDFARNGQGLPLYLEFAPMLSLQDWQDGNWAEKIRGVATDPQRPPAHGLDNAGFWTMGLGTCVGVAMTFSNGAGAASQVGLVHLTNLLVLDASVGLATILATMVGRGRAVGALQRVVLGYELGNPHQPAMTLAIVQELDMLGVTEGKITQFLDNRPAGAQVAVNAALQIGTW